MTTLKYSDLAYCCLQALCEEAEAADEPAVSQGTRVRYGFAFLDAAAARFYVGSATDDGSRANLTALLTQARFFAPVSEPNSAGMALHCRQSSLATWLLWVACSGRRLTCRAGGPEGGASPEAWAITCYRQVLVVPANAFAGYSSEAGRRVSRSC